MGRNLEQDHGQIWGWQLKGGQKEREGKGEGQKEERIEAMLI